MAKDILFITSNRLGDAVLSTGLLNHLLEAEAGARVTIACGPLPASLFEGYPALKEIIPFAKEKHHMHWVRLWSRLVGTRWDMVIDLRNSAVSRLIQARRRYIYGRHIDQTIHKVRQAAAVMGLDTVPPPALWPSAAQCERAAELIPGGAPVLGIGPTANWTGKTWPAERFIELIARLIAPGGVMEGVRVAVFAAPGEEAQALPVLESIPVERRIDIIAKVDPGTAAAALARCNWYIGHDSGLMHTAAAVGIPTIGLFGPSWPHLYGPWGDHAAWVSTPEPYDKLIDFPGYDPKTAGSLMTGLSVDTVFDAVVSKFCR